MGHPFLRITVLQVEEKFKLQRMKAFFFFSTTELLIAYLTFKTVFKINLFTVNSCIISCPNYWKVVRKRHDTTFKLNLPLERDVYKHLERNMHLLFNIR